VSKLTEPLLQEFEIRKVANKADILHADLIISVDVGHQSLLSEDRIAYEESHAKKVIIDHHNILPRSNDSEVAQQPYSLEIRDETVSSTCQLIGEVTQSILRKTGGSSKISQSLLTGIVFDSQNFRLADCRTIATVSLLCTLGAEIAPSRKLLFLPKERSETIARLKGAQRSKFEEINGWIVARSHVSSFQASVARALIELGADFAAVAGSQERGKTICSLRATQNFVDKTGIELASKFLPQVKLNSDLGGGHPTAATITTTRSADQVFTAIWTALNTLIEKPPKLDKPLSPL
jgi:phosphoesterase RecJ-like protein